MSPLQLAIGHVREAKRMVEAMTPTDARPEIRRALLPLSDALAWLEAAHGKKKPVRNNHLSDDGSEP